MYLRKENSRVSQNLLKSIWRKHDLKMCSLFLTVVGRRILIGKGQVFILNKLEKV